MTTQSGATAGTGVPPTRKDRRWLWILALLLSFALGLWLGRQMMPRCAAYPVPRAAGSGDGGGGGGGHSGAANGGSGDSDKDGGQGGDGKGIGRVKGEGGHVDGGGGGGAPGSGVGSGTMEGGGKADSNGTTVGHGYDGSAKGASGSDDSGGGASGTSKPGGSPNGLDADPESNRIASAVARLATGTALADSYAADTSEQGKSRDVKVMSAPDFSYDKTGLPRYPDQNKSVYSAISYPLPGRTDVYGSGSGIVTGSGFEDVVAWYQKSLPPGWSNSATGTDQLETVAQTLSPNKIMQMLSGSSDATTAKQVGENHAADAAERTRLAMFSPPAGTKGEPGIMIVQRGDRPVTIMMKNAIPPQGS